MEGQSEQAGETGQGDMDEQTSENRVIKLIIKWK